MKVIQASTFSFRDFDDYVESGHDCFSVSRFGYEYLKKWIGTDNYQVVFPENGRLLRLAERLLGSEGRSLVLQLRCAFNREADVIYYPTDRHIWCLAILRWLRICRAPILYVSHFTFNTKYVNGSLKRILLRIERMLVLHSIDKVVFANERLLQLAVQDYSVPHKQRIYSCWGADLPFFIRTSEVGINMRGDYYLAAGGVNRDYEVLIKAFASLPYKLVISCNPELLTAYGKLPNNIEVFDYKKYGKAASEGLRYLYQHCKAVLISIANVNHVPNGASVMVEAIACGKPLIVSDADTNYLDVEEEGIGYKVQMHDVGDWVNKIRRMDELQDDKEMRENLKQLAQKYNYESFAKDMLETLAKIAKKRENE